MEAQINDPKIIFWGTPNFSVFILEELKKCGILPDLIIASPDKPKGRNLIMTPPPVKIWADKNNINSLQPEKLKDLKLEGSYVLCILAAYGKIIPQNILSLPKFGFLNVHPSLLPKWRGPSPMQYSILSGDEETGVSIILLDEEMDHGPIIRQEKISLKNHKPTYTELEKMSAEIGGKMLCEIIPKWIGGEIKPITQDHSKATFCKKIEKKDGFIRPEIILGLEKDQNKIMEAERKVRALNPDPGTYTIIKIREKDIRIKIISAKIEENKFFPEKIIPEGKKEMLWNDFLKGNKLGS